MCTVNIPSTFVSSLSCAVGVHEATFRVDKCRWIALGVISAAKTSVSGCGWNLGYMWSSDGYYCVRGHQESMSIKYGEGDAITVCLDLDANTIAFHKNGEVVNDFPVPLKIAPGEEYNFAFDGYTDGNAVTIVDYGAKARGTRFE